MANKKLQRKKPGYTKNGEVKIISLGTGQLVELLDKTQKKKIQAKIRRRLNDLGYVAPEVIEEVIVEEVVAE
jgi:hypothetical protein